MPEKTDSILELLSAGRWRSAVFTTYTLSLSYVESHILPRLRASNCQKVTVYADVAGYRDSLVEQNARHPGREYTVVPVKSATGIFHPKLLHLRAEDGDADLLLVGSGNLTYSGHGGNVEVLEVLRPSLHAQAFEEAADFFEALVDSETLTVLDHSDLLITADRLRDVARRGATVEDVHFVHSLTEPGEVQFIRAAQGRAAKWEELIVLSPYHHPNAAPVHHLVLALGVSMVSVGVSSRPQDTCAFPYSVAQGWDVHLKAVAPLAPGTPRGVHAKWFEVRNRDEALLLTGSFNATDVSFCTKRNVECGVLRASSARSDPWTDTSWPAFKASEFPGRQQADSFVLVARLTGPTALTAQLVAGPDHAQWEARLEFAHGVSIKLADAVNLTGGTLTWVLEKPVPDHAGASMQLHLRSGPLSAVGWVNAVRVLSMSADRRALLQALARMNASAGEESDVDLITNIVCEHANSLWNGTQITPVRGSDSSFGRDEGDSPALPDMSAEVFKAWGATDIEDNTRFNEEHAAAAVQAGASGWALLRHVLTALHALPARRTASGDGVPRFVREAGEEVLVTPPPEPKKKKSLEEKLAKAERVLNKELDKGRKALSSARDQATRHRIVLGQARIWAVWSPLVLKVRLQMLDQHDRCLRFHEKWLREMCALELPQAEKAIFTEATCGVAAALCLSYQLDTPKKDPVERGARQIHRWLDRYFGGTDFHKQALDEAGSWLQSELGHDLVLKCPAEALSALQQALEVPTERQVLRRVFHDGLQEHRREAEEILGAEQVAKIEQFHFSLPGRKSLYTQVDIRTLVSCPCCYVSYLQGPMRRRWLDSDLSRRLRQHGFTKCTNCSHVLVALGV